MKLGTVTKPDKRDIATSKRFDDDVMSESYNVIVIFQFMVHLEQPGSRFLNVGSAEVMFS